MTIEIEDFKKLNIGPGDVVIVNCKNHDYSVDDMKRFRAELKNVIPDDVPVIIAGPDIEIGAVDKDKLLEIARWNPGDKD